MRHPQRPESGIPFLLLYGIWGHLVHKPNPILLGGKGYIPNYITSNKIRCEPSADRLRSPSHNRAMTASDRPSEAIFLGPLGTSAIGQDLAPASPIPSRPYNDLCDLSVLGGGKSGLTLCKSASESRFAQDDPHPRREHQTRPRLRDFLDDVSVIDDACG